MDFRNNYYSIAKEILVDDHLWLYLYKYKKKTYVSVART